MRTTLLALGLGIAVLGGPPARAGTPVRYRVDQKVFKKQVAAATPLAFELHDDAACQNAALHTESKAAGDASLSFEFPVTKGVKGGPKPVKQTEIRTVLGDTGLSGPLFLAVTGDGIVPVGGACQPQVAAAGEPGPPGPPGDDAFALFAVVDADGTLARGSPGVSSGFFPAPLSYEVLFDRDVSGCAYVEAIGNVSSGYPPPGSLGVAPRVGVPNGVYVVPYDTSGTAVQRSFHLGVLCD
jgi:hypothetical protein